MEALSRNSGVSESALASRFWGPLRLFAMRRLGDVTAAEDVAQETLRRVVEALRAGKVENRAAIAGFVFQTARNICLHRYRSAHRERRALLWLHARASGPFTPEPLGALVTEERRADVRDALGRIGEGDRELLHLFYYRGLSTEEVAEQLGLTPGTVRVRKHRALQRLEAALRAGDETPADDRELSG